MIDLFKALFYLRIIILIFKNPKLKGDSKTNVWKFFWVFVFQYISTYIAYNFVLRIMSLCNINKHTNLLFLKY